jgi:hypothetical protein
VVPELRGTAGEQPLQTDLPELRLLHELRGLLLGAPELPLERRPSRLPYRDTRRSGAHFIDISLTIAVPYVRRSHTPPNA